MKSSKPTEFISKGWKYIHKDISKKTSQILPTNPFTKTFNKVSSIQRLPVNSLFKKKKRKDFVNIALISLLEIEGLRSTEYTLVNKKTRGVDVGACKRLLVNYSPRFAAKLLSSFKEGLSIALDQFNADIVCVNELGFPLKNDKVCKEANIFTQKMAEKYNCLIFAGTVHDHRTYLNTGYFFYPGCNTDRRWYHKQVSAQKLQPIAELISIPPNRTSYYARVFGINVAFLICLDLADYSSVAAIVNLGERVNLLIVPSYSKWTESLEKTAITISDAISGGVAIVNYYQGGGKPSSYLYMYGEERPKNVDTHKIIGNKNGLVVLHKINLIELQQEKVSLRKKLDPKLEWLFGLQRIEPR